MPCEHSRGDPCSACRVVMVKIDEALDLSMKKGGCQLCHGTGFHYGDGLGTPGKVPKYPCGLCEGAQKPRFPIMLDSGAYSAATLGVEIDLDRYIAFCHKFRVDYPQAVYVSLDVIGNGKKSHENWRIMRDAGLNPMPVFHPLPRLERKWLFKYLDETKHVGLGGLVGVPGALRRSALAQSWELLIGQDRMPIAKVHGMGMSSVSDLVRYPWHSVDSSSWMRSATFGETIVPKRRGGVWDFTTLPHKIKTDLRAGWEARDAVRDHINDLSEPERQALYAYLREINIPLGFIAKLKGGGTVICKGVRTNLKARAFAGLEFFARFTRELRWPRPLAGAKRRPGFFDELREPNPERRPVIWRRKDPPCMTYYLSATVYSAERYVLQHRDRMPHVGVLNNFYNLSLNAENAANRDLAFLKGR